MVKVLDSVVQMLESIVKMVEKIMQINDGITLEIIESSVQFVGSIMQIVDINDGINGANYRINDVVGVTNGVDD